jgi:hypothetical protein
MESKLDITTRDDKVFSVVLEDSVLCIQVMQIIQERCLPASAGAANTEDGTQQRTALSSTQSVDLLGLESISGGSGKGKGEDAGELQPLCIGSSPKRTSSRRMVNKRAAKTKLMVNIKKYPSMNNHFEGSKENGVINRLPPPPPAATTACGTDAKKIQEVNLIDFDEVEGNSNMSPAKKMKLSNNTAVDTATKQDPQLDLSSRRLPTAVQAAVTQKAAVIVVEEDAHYVPPAHLKKYANMIKSGVPRDAVKQKMTMEGMCGDDITSVCSAVASTVLPSESTADATKTTDDIPAHLKKYQIMMKSGVPQNAVKQKMTLEGVSADEISRVVGSGPVTASVSTSVSSQNKTTETSTAATSIPAHLKKYQIMMKSGVPPNAVKQKMSLEGVSADDINLVFGIQSQEISPALKKFQVMLKSGIPPGAVGHKMTMEGVSAADQARVLGKSLSAPSGSSAGGLSTPKAPAGPQLLGLHWDPIAENNDSLSKSMWGDIHSPSDGAETVNNHQLQEKEFDSLSSMFSRKATPASTKAGAKASDAIKGGAISSDRNLRSKSKMPTTIDMSRSTNISIGMSSFKQKKLTAEKIVQAINLLDTGVLQHEDLCRLFEILPSDSEKKIFSGKMSATRIEGFHDTEKWLYQLSMIENCKEKVDAMIFMTSFSMNSDASKKDLQALVSFTELVVGSAALKEVMKCILAIGNSLNQGTYKGGARGFRLGSLLKLHQTKSTDGKSTVMDYLIQVSLIVLVEYFKLCLSEEDTIMCVTQ